MESGNLLGSMNASAPLFLYTHLIIKSKVRCLP